MECTCWIVGLPNGGKSTLFNDVTAAGAWVVNYPFCTTEPNIRAIRDKRLETLSSLYKPVRVSPSVIHLMEIAGLVRL